MKWTEVALRVDGQLTDTIAEIFSEYGYQGVAIERDGIMPDRWDEVTLPQPTQFTVRAYLPENGDLTNVQQQLEDALRGYSLETPIYRTVSEENWAEAWKQHYHPLRVGQRIVVRPTWEPADLKPDDIEIALDPGMAFGTGTHPTTQLCLEAIEDWMPPGQSVLDLGCGSGILSIAAAKLGASNIFAIDVDPVAVEAARENIADNGVADQVQLATGGLPEVLEVGRQYDFAAVNILARIIIQMCPVGLGQVVRPGGRAIFSGLIESQVDEVEHGLRHTGLVPLRRRQLGDWILIEAEAPS
jgi:ribosomal protein L11 methyltransferase